MTKDDTPGFARNPVAWLLLAIPAATVAAGIWTFMVASGESAVDAQPDPVRRTAQVQVVAMDADEKAARLGLAATVELRGEGAVVRVEGPGGTVAPVLQLVHPIESSLDRSLALAPGPDGWSTTDAVAAGHAWQVRLVAADGHWRLVGRYHPGDASVRLEPALPAP